jgi:hypothetical protein
MVAKRAGARHGLNNLEEKELGRKKECRATVQRLSGPVFDRKSSPDAMSVRLLGLTAGSQESGCRVDCPASRIVQWIG